MSRRYRFRLESVLRVRRIEEDRAAGALAFANVEARNAATERAARQAAYAALPSLAVRAGTEDFVVDRWRRSAAAASVAGGLADEAAALEVVDERRTDWSAAAQRTSALERLDGRRREEHELAAGRDETIAVDELVTGRFVRERSR